MQSPTPSTAPGSLRTAGAGTTSSIFINNDYRFQLRCPPHLGDLLRADAADADGDGEPELVFADWCAYDSSTHTLAPADVLYFMRAADGAFHRLRFLSHYNDADEPGFLSFEHGPVDGY